MSSEATRPLSQPLVEAVPSDRPEWLIDNADAYAALISAIRDARDSIWISQLALDADCVAYEVGSTRASTTIVGELLAASRRGVQVRVLLNASLLLDTAKPLRAHLEKAGADTRRFRVRGVSRFPQLLHAKLVVVDAEVALLIGSPFANGYWDDADHAPIDPRRPMRELAGRPVHDVSTLITGPAVATLGATFAALWNDADDVMGGDEEDLAVAGHPTALADSPMRIVHTAPGDGPMEILPALLEGIASAEWLIYVEHQYLSARPVVDALVQALARHRTLEVVVLLNQNPDVTAYRGWQNARLRESGLLEHPRVGLFTLWTSALESSNHVRQLNQVFVHSKVVAIDDRWLLVGSANLDGVSLHSYGDDFSSRLGRWIFRGVRNFDVGAVIDAEQDDESAEQVRALRARLWKEHLGGSFHEIGARPTGGWIPLWRSVARRNAAELGKGGRARCLDGPFILPYSSKSTPRAQLADVGVVFAPDTLELCFAPSWLEVHCSPNWVRNMFG
ncbi:MAG TPA: phosphatidylserine/phosphatidylglycerophosphate/cardiolipin synthase family protein [Gemmatimonadaceae bacterium]|nr:phosphatidylserine/phosphatidylglycerophosphate/cardiolipin synthase family protein [Gemmatimonadaceae bacterium]